MATIRIGLVDDHERFRRCIGDLLADQPGIDVIAQYDSGEAALAALRHDRLGDGDTLPDVLVMDVAMRGIGGIEATRRLLMTHPLPLHVLALTMHDEPQFVAAMLAAGALGYVLKDDPFADLVQALRQVATGQAGFSRSIQSVQTPAAARISGT